MKKALASVIATVLEKKDECDGNHAVGGSKINDIREAREMILEPRLIILTGRFTLFGLNRKYSILFELTDNLFDIIHENTSLIQDSIIGKVDEANSGENDK